MANHFFSLVIVPDSGSDIKSGIFNIKVVFSLFCILFITFIICLFFVVGYHIKLSQEREFNNLISTMNRLHNHIDKSKKILNTLSEKLLSVQKNDIALRKIAFMDVLDKDMYEAGIGGHALVDEALFSNFNGNFKDDLRFVSLDITKLASRLNVQEESLGEINEKFQKNQKEINSTPSQLPTNSFRITSSYSWRRNPFTGKREFHRAVDLGGKRGDRIHATANGVVISAKYYQGALGHCVRIRHGYGYETLYGHLNEIMVKQGQKVKKNEIIGTMGSSGRASGVHIHYAILHFGDKINPMKYFSP